MTSLRRITWPLALGALAVIAVVWFGALASVEAVLGQSVSWSNLSSIDPETAESILGNFPEVIVGILAITVTVVTITLQLAATRYNHGVTEMFFRDAGNLGVLSFYVLAALHAIAAGALIRNGVVPHVMLTSTLVIAAIATLLLIPYFIYVFAFLDPARLVAQLKAEVTYAFIRATSHRSTEAGRRLQASIRTALEQLTDVAIHAVSQSDRGIACLVSESLGEIADSYSNHKSRLPEHWFELGKELRAAPEIVVLESSVVTRMQHQHCWLEWMILRQMSTIYGASLNTMHDVARHVSIDAHKVAAAAMRISDSAAAGLAVRNFNSFLRAAINRRDVRTAYNVFDQYRDLAESALSSQLETITYEVADHMGFYGRLANMSGLPFVTETAAFDLARLCERAHRANYGSTGLILSSLLDVDKRPESREEEASLRGVRKAQTKLATFFLAEGALESAQLIAEDMVNEPQWRLDLIREELASATNPEYREIIDRGQNFDYMSPRRCAELDRFFEMVADARS